MDITTDQLRQMIQLRERIEFLQDLLQRIRGGKAATNPAGQNAQRTRPKAAPRKSFVGKTAPKKMAMSPEAKAKIAAAMKARWAAKRKDAAAA